MKRVVLCGLVVSTWAGCGDNLAPATVDLDAAEPLEIFDAPIGRTGPQFTGSIAFLEVAVLNADGSVFGQGPQANITFVDNTRLPPPLLEEQPGPLGCKVWRYNRTEALAATVGVDQGPVEITELGAPNVSMPECAYAANVGYRCLDAASGGNSGTMTATGTAGRITLTDLNSTFSASAIGQYVQISGSTIATNNGTFPIVARPAGDAAGHSIIFVNPEFVAESSSTPVTHMNVAGAGPLPGVADPGFISDTAEVDITHTMGGLGALSTFSAVTAPTTVADDFALIANRSLNEVPRNGSAFAVSCNAANCPSDSATINRLDIVTTDASVLDQSPFAMPPPADKQVHIQCTSLATTDGTTLTVPAAYMEHVNTAGATRIRATFTRGTVLSDSLPVVEVLAGHAVTGFN